MQFELFSDDEGEFSEETVEEGVEEKERAVSGFDEELTEKSQLLLRELKAWKLAKKVAVFWNARMRSTAGRAFWPEMRIDLNPRLREISLEQVERTLRHELAHLLAYKRAGRRRIQAHGLEWQEACADLGIAGESATHSLPLPVRRQRRHWRYVCPACGEGIERVKRIRGLAACYICCRKEGKGQYLEKYQLVESKL